MKYKRAIVRNCGDCGCAGGDVNREKPRCVLTGRVIEDSFAIPDWCPLEDASTVDQKTVQGG